MSDSKKMPVVFITDDNYAMPTAVAITSLYYNKAENSNYEVNIICVDVNEENVGYLKELNRDDFPVNLFFLNKDAYMDLEMQNFHVSVSAIYKFKLPEIFDKYDTILYLDSDMLITRDISELFDINIKGRYAAVVKDYKTSTYKPTQLQKLHIEHKHKFYFNSGMMLLNLKKMREDDIPRKLHEYRKNGINFFMDQDALNVVFSENVIYLPFKYNVMTTLLTLYKPEIIRGYYEFDEYKTVEEALSKASIVHCTGPLKPWEHLMPTFSDLYAFYYDKSVYAKKSLRLLDNDLVVEKGQENLKDRVSVVYITDNSLARLTATSITSLLHNRNVNVYYDIYVYHNKITPENLYRLNMLNAKRFTIHAIEITQYDRETQFDMLKKAISPMTLTKFYIAEVLPKVEKAIFIANNTLVLKDLASLYCMDIEEQYAAVVEDYRIGSYNPSQTSKLNLSYERYFNTGMMLLNLKKLRNDNMGQKLLYYKKFGVNYFEDQDAFNVCFENNVKYLSMYLNLQDNILDTYKKEVVWSKAEIKKYSSYAELLSRCYVFQMNRKSRPWDSIVPLVSDVFLRYYIQSPYEDVAFNSTEINDAVTMIKTDMATNIKPELVANDFYYQKTVAEYLYPSQSIKFENRYLEYINGTLNQFRNNIKDGLNKRQRDVSVTVSLTTIPYRIEAAADVIAIMLNQTYKPDRIVLYLGEDEFKEKELPKLLQKEMECGVEVRYRKDIICHTKYFYAMQEFPDDIIITVDDDILYDTNLVEELMNSYSKHPDAVSSMRVHQITFDKNGKIAPYRKWKMCNCDYINIPSHKLLATGVGGVLYPPHCFNSEIFNLKAIKDLAPRADDLWLKIMEIISDVKVVLVKRQKPLSFLGDTQNVGLCYENVDAEGNDTQWNKLMVAYDNFDTQSSINGILQANIDRIPMFNIDASISNGSVYQIQIDKLKQELESKNKKIRELSKICDSKVPNTIISKEVIKDTKAIRDLEKANDKIEDLTFELSEIRKSRSYKLAMLITWLPRKLRSKKK